MARQRRTARWGACPVAVALLAALVGCGAAPGAADREDRAIQTLLDRWSAALLARDAGAFLAAVDPAATDYRDRQRRLFDNLREVPLAEWRYRLTRRGGFPPAPVPGGGRRVAVEVDLDHRIAGHDTAPVTAARRLTLTERDGRWYAAADSTTGARPLWEQGPVDAVRGEHGLVLGVGQDPERLRALARAADRAVPAVDRAWRRPWARRVVLLVPASVAGMGQLLGAPAAGYRDIAAVTTGEVGGSGAAPADRIVVNPEAYHSLGEEGREVVLTHEATHVATRSATSPATPLWLSEGFADWVGYRGTGRTAHQNAPALARAVAAGRPPRELPADGDFAFSGGGERLALAYERGWLACEMIAERWGAERLVELYRTVGEGRAPLDAALRQVLGTGQEEFTASWRAYAHRRLR
ncbi:hypothetical protein [Streptomyces sp. URMC 123]|uniref:hypothetical protein n=1 Tax=Streptomyces sp. URMC 123 TaxID=3423403 RepID=UPI003F1AA734